MDTAASASMTAVNIQTNYANLTVPLLLGSFRSKKDIAVTAVFGIIKELNKTVSLQVICGLTKNLKSIEFILLLNVLGIKNICECENSMQKDNVIST